MGSVQPGEVPHYDGIKELKSFDETKTGVKGIVDLGLEKINGDIEVKKQLYVKDLSQKVKYDSNFDLYKSRSSNWRDTFRRRLLNPDPIDPQLLPGTFRDIIVDYWKHIMNLGDTLVELLSEALGLNKDHLKGMNCTHYLALLVLGVVGFPATTHSDQIFFTIVLQDQVVGLQFFYQNQWVTVKPILGALTINISDLIQSSRNHVGPRVSVRYFYRASLDKLLYLIKELIFESNMLKSMGLTNLENQLTRNSLHLSSCVITPTILYRMEIAGANGEVHHYDRNNELKAFDETKAGIPRISVRTLGELTEDLAFKNDQDNKFEIPLIDLQGMDQRCKEIIDEVRLASETWGFFQLVNHGIPMSVTNEEDAELKKHLYKKDLSRKVEFDSNFILYKSRSANWRDTLRCLLSTPDPINPEELPDTCRYNSAFRPKFLHYSSPRLYWWTKILNQSCWVSVKPIPGALIVNIGDLLQLIFFRKMSTKENKRNPNRLHSAIKKIYHKTIKATQNQNQTLLGVTKFYK
ncbi:hypothetical protein MKX01_042677 [Papaver californicum]|nr:hypothetical protein MKX01_042677 [Papaver californicum]